MSQLTAASRPQPYLFCLLLCVFKDPWIPEIPGFRLSRQDDVDLKAEEWINYDRSEWKSEEVRNYCNPTEAEAILKIPIGGREETDPWVWHYDKKGIFTVKSAYHSIHGREDRQRVGSATSFNEERWKWLWNLKIPPKIKFFLWRATNNALATARNLWRRNCGNSPMCQVCQRGEENVIHCLFECHHASQVWRKLLPATNPPDDFKKITKWIYEKRSNTDRDYVLSIISGMWCIWKARNEKIFRQASPSTESTLYWIIRQKTEWKRISEVEGNTAASLIQAPNSMLRPPPEDSILQQIYCDGSFTTNSVAAGYGVVVINSHGQVIDGKAGSLLCSSSIVAEAKAILVAIQVAASLEGPTIIKSDCLNLILALRDFKIAWPWECAAWMGQMRHILEENPRISISFIPRRMNRATDWIANSARRAELSENWTSCASLLSLV